MKHIFETLLGESFNGNSPAIEKDISKAERILNISFPEDFRDFLMESNGGEGSIGENYVMLWNTDELGEYNNSYQVDEYAKGLVLFGSDGGGEAFAFDMRTSPPPIVSVPFVGVSLEYANPLAGKFVAFLEKLGN